ncbi:hypothetical protein ACW9KT_17665 [Hymenobacter sp. HD11105]
MNNEDFDTFKREVSWFINPTDKIEIKASDFNCSENFILTFPTLYKLISQAQVLEVTMTRKRRTNHYKLYSWIDDNNLKYGWLCKFESSENSIKILPEHELLLDNIGGIQESYMQNETQEELLTDNQNFIFIKSMCTKGLGGWKQLYEQECENGGAKQIDTENLICFVGEANGNETFYNLNSNQVLLFAPDHCFDNVEVLKDQPEYTFYTINNVTTFIDYAEALARQWLYQIGSVDI